MGGIMISAGIDSGSTTTKVVILEDHAVRVSLVVPTGDFPQKTARDIYQRALEEASLKEGDVTVIATTGYGRRLIGFGDIVVTEIKACATGVLFDVKTDETIHTIIDVGGQDTKVMAIDDEGEIEDFSMNDKCAAGTGRFIEMLALKLGLSYEECANLALQSEKMIPMNATCAVFAESEVVGLVARGESKADIAAAAHQAIASRIRSMVRRVGQRGSYCFVGGGAKNPALVKALEENLGHSVFVPPNAQVLAAIGAAVGGRQRFEKIQKRENHE
ncbi:MAG: hypothetical protein JXA52_09115 [Planctomycetes bacterium]|nr:hypothetical protein [Planctomycetota bacterium]